QCCESGASRRIFPIPPFSPSTCASAASRNGMRRPIGRTNLPSRTSSANSRTLDGSGCASTRVIVVRQNQIARTTLTFKNLEETISRHVRVPTRLVSVDLAVHQRPSSPRPGEPCTPSTVGCLQAAQQAPAVKALRSPVLDRAGKTLEGLATSLGSSAPRYGRSLATAAFP